MSIPRKYVLSPEMTLLASNGSSEKIYNGLKEDGRQKLADKSKMWATQLYAGERDNNGMDSSKIEAQAYDKIVKYITRKPQFQTQFYVSKAVKKMQPQIPKNIEVEGSYEPETLIFPNSAKADGGHLRRRVRGQHGSIDSRFLKSRNMLNNNMTNYVNIIGDGNPDGQDYQRDSKERPQT